MKPFFILFLFISFTAHASPLMSVKDRLRLHLWSVGIEDSPVKVKTAPKVLPEEIERPLRKLQ
jgi:hypothetical protein